VKIRYKLVQSGTAAAAGSEASRGSKPDYSQAVAVLGATEALGGTLEAALEKGDQAAALKTSGLFLEQLRLLDAQVRGTELELPANVVSLASQMNEAIKAGDMKLGQSLAAATSTAADKMLGGDFEQRLLKLAAQQREATQPHPATNSSASNGTTVEILGVSKHPSIGQAWWGKDGSPAKPVPELSGIQVSSDDSSRVLRELVVQIHGAVTNPSLAFQSLPGEDLRVRGTGSHILPDRCLGFAVVDVPKTSASASLRVLVAGSDWMTAAETKNLNGLSTTGGRCGEAEWSITVVAPHSLRKGKTRVTTVYNRNANWEERIAVVDAAGKRHTGGFSSTSGGTNETTNITDFDVPPEQIAAVRLEVRPFHAIEIGGIAMNPMPEKADAQGGNRE
jgi:hypothetical protein